MSVEDPFEIDFDRDRFGRPRIIPTAERKAHPLVQPARGDDKKFPDHLPYTRISTLSGYLGDHSAIHTWEKRALVKGMGEREDLAAMAAGLPAIIGNRRNKDTMSKAERDIDSITNARLDEIGEVAMQHAGRDYKASWGTAIHSFCAPGGGTEVPERMLTDVESYRTATAGFRFLGNEVRVVNDDLQAAGTFDDLVQVPWLPHLGAMVLDKKSGILHRDQVGIQLYAYASGTPYDVETEQRTEWPVQPSTSWGIVAHIPFGLGRTDLWLVDLNAGKAAAEHAIAVRAWRSRKDLVEPMSTEGFHAARYAYVEGLVRQADSAQTLSAIYQDFAPIWTQELTDLGNLALRAA